ncbi:leucine-rich_repeat domain-containing protein [Hexamita inflata]|uniref:Leucine-rich repeat domain-containing protein n=1 Tax=Hexamita inflata TaxID=28002 RepID=A0AA86QEC4_9EUKA|nr:leucine-rich repeat domain-containing protein [Hexamita inflata]
MKLVANNKLISSDVVQRISDYDKSILEIYQSININGALKNIDTNTQDMNSIKQIVRQSFNKQEFKKQQRLIKKQKFISSISNFDSFCQYDKQMINFYVDHIKSGKLTIQFSRKLNDVYFIRTFNIKKLVLYNFMDKTPKLFSQTIIQFCTINSSISNLNDYQIDNLEILELTDGNSIIGIQKFKRLKEVSIWRVDISPISQVVWLTKLKLYYCGMDSTKALRPLVNLTELYINDTKQCDITSLQFLTNLTKLKLSLSKLVSIDALRPLYKLKELYITYNSIIYLQPVLELKQLQYLSAEYNLIVDSKDLETHPCFQNFHLGKQYQPTQEQCKDANIMRHINNPIVYLRIIHKKQIKLISYRSLFALKIKKNIEKQYTNIEQVTNIVVLLFQKLNSQECCQ